MLTQGYQNTGLEGAEVILATTSFTIFMLAPFHLLLRWHHQSWRWEQSEDLRQQVWEHSRAADPERDIRSDAVGRRCAVRLPNGDFAVCRASQHKL